jgi:hypothetical protein
MELVQGREVLQMAGITEIDISLIIELTLRIISESRIISHILQGQNQEIDPF